MKYLILAVFTLLLGAVCAQTSLTVQVTDATTAAPLAGASVSLMGSPKGALADENGLARLSNIPKGEQIILVRYLGYIPFQQAITVPLSDSLLVISLSPEAVETEETVIEGTRSNRHIDDIPTRVEALTEEIDEASTMDPSKIAHLITHSTGIQVQQTSATSNTANVRIQGLDGRYTQILKDGFPIYGGFSGSLSIMQIPPLDLRQVEYIKGGASTLYGAGAIAGLINLISKDPRKEETLIHLNASQLGALDVNTFISRKFKKTGFTLLAQRNTHRFFDADNDGFTDLPELTKYNFNPKVFFYFTPKTTLSAGATFTQETRSGGDVHLLAGNPADSSHFYSERNDINRITTQVKLSHSVGENQQVEVRNSVNYFDRELRITPSFALGQYRFAGVQVSSFSEIAYTRRKQHNVLIAGLNVYTDDFEEAVRSGDTARTEQYRTAGAFVNYVFDLGPKVSIESGLRADQVFNHRVYVLPRVSALVKWTGKLTTRIGGGMGYRNASMFNQEAEILGYRNVQAVNQLAVSAEQSYGGNADIGYKTPLGEHFSLIFNQMFFYSRLSNPLILKQTGTQFAFENADGYTQSYGAETFFKLGFYDFVWFIGYTFTHASTTAFGPEQVLPLTPRHSLKGDLLYALPGKWRIGFDYEFKSAQTLASGRTTPSYWTTGAVVEYTTGAYTLFGNVENFGNLRQTQFESLRSAPYNTPQFTEVWAPLDGFVFNAGIKLRLENN